MRNENTIALFVEDHFRIASLFDEFKKSKSRNHKKSIEIFNQLSQALQKHFREEEVLYSKYKRRTGNKLPIIQTIGAEHSILLNKLMEISEGLRSGNENIDITGFHTILERHKNIEERTLYPELDAVLTDKEKEEVYEELTEK